GEDTGAAGPGAGVDEPVHAGLDQLDVAEDAQPLEVVEAQLGGDVTGGGEPAAIGREAPAERVTGERGTPIASRPQRARIDRVQPRRRTCEPVERRRPRRVLPGRAHGAPTKPKAAA